MFYALALILSVELVFLTQMILSVLSVINAPLEDLVVVVYVNFLVNGKCQTSVQLTVAILMSGSNKFSMIVVSLILYQVTNLLTLLKRLKRVVLLLQVHRQCC